ncbi:MAG: DUF952 domain-containing protein [Bacteroidota bacterium]|nr:DUF952 domain-containing protein [Bacteroidota bacterium]
MSGVYNTESLKTEGFIHCSSPEDFEETANLHYKNEKNILVLSIDASKVEPEIKMEMAVKRGKIFPHIYGPLNTSAIENIIVVSIDKNGKFSLPKNF